MNQFIKRTALSLSAAAGGILGGLLLWQRTCFRQAEKKSDDSLLEKYPSSAGELAYYALGQGEPLVLVHSMLLGASSREWAAVAETLAQHNRIYALDLPGFGASFTPRQPWTAYQYAGILREFLDNVVGGAAYMLSSNGGADLALVTSMLYPEKIRGHFLISPMGFHRGFATNDEVRPLKGLLLPVAGTQKFLMHSSKKKMRQLWEEHFFAKEKLSPEMVHDLCLAARRSARRQSTFAGLQTNFWQAATRAAFTALSVPFWLLWGEENTVNPLEALDWAEEMRPDGEFIIFEGTGSYPHLENSAAFADLITDCLADAGKKQR